MDDKTFTVHALRDYPSEYIRSPERMPAAIEQIARRDGLVGIDIETMPKPEYKHIPKAALSPLLSSIRLLQIFDGEKIWVFDLRTLGTLAPFIPLLQSKRFVAHNALFEISHFLAKGVEHINCACTMLIAKLMIHATYPDDGGMAASLASVVKMLFEVDIEKAMQRSDWGAEDLSFEQVEYSALDSIWTYLCAEKLAPGLRNKGMERIYKVVKEAQEPIARMQLNGLKVDVPYYRGLIDDWRGELFTDKKKVLKLTGLQDITNAKLGKWLEANLPEDILRIWPRTETERLATNADVFADFSFLEIVKPFSAFQKKMKLTSTYGNSLLAAINPRSRRLHSYFHLLGARTGRLSSSSPNQQNLPRDEKIRSAFISEEGKVLIRADYNQIELRVAAELSQDQTMLEAYRQGIDLHALTASKVTSKPLNAVTETDRQLAKAINFGFLFGLGAKKFSHYARKSYGVEVDKEESNEVVRVFRETYPGYREWQMDRAEEGRSTFLSRTPLGKVRKLSDINAYGASMNTPVQGGAAEVVQIALRRIHNNLPDGVDLVNCVHDEIVLEAEEELKEEAGRVLEGCMIEAYREVFPKGIIRGLVKVGSGKTWADAK